MRVKDIKTILPMVIFRIPMLILELHKIGINTYMLTNICETYKNFTGSDKQWKYFYIIIIKTLYIYSIMLELETCRGKYHGSLLVCINVYMCAMLPMTKANTKHMEATLKCMKHKSQQEIYNAVKDLLIEYSEDIDPIIKEFF